MRTTMKAANSVTLRRAMKPEIVPMTLATIPIKTRITTSATMAVLEKETAAKSTVPEAYPTPTSLKRMSQKHLRLRQPEAQAVKQMLIRAERGHRTTVTIRLYQPIPDDPVEAVKTRLAHLLTGRDFDLEIPPP
ncbi:hypothetical protein EDC01DRAFT_778391 [Geopyxis carbonaria]|nr:hypothetical protein EDC01DRAFT_778391 [Geopyxis carbonaria]